MSRNGDRTPKRAGSAGSPPSSFPEGSGMRGTKRTLIISGHLMKPANGNGSTSKLRSVSTEFSAANGTANGQKGNTGPVRSSIGSGPKPTGPRLESQFARNLRQALVRDIVEAHEDQLLIDMRVGTLKAMGLSNAAIQRKIGLSAADVSGAVERLARCSDRLAA